MDVMMCLMTEQMFGGGWGFTCGTALRCRPEDGGRQWRIPRERGRRAPVGTWTRPEEETRHRPADDDAAAADTTHLLNLRVGEEATRRRHNGVHCRTCRVDTRDTKGAVCRSRCLTLDHQGAVGYHSYHFLHHQPHNWTERRRHHMTHSVRGGSRYLP